MSLTAVLSPPLAAAPKPRPTLDVNPRTGMAVPSFDQLVRAVKQRDRGAMERIAGRLGPGRLGQGLAQTDRRVVLAVLTVLPDVRGAALLTEPVADLTTSSDATVAVAAARALGDLLSGDQPADLEHWDVPVDVVNRGCAALRGLALYATAVPTRLAGLRALADAGGACPDTDGVLPALRDSDPLVRRAAAQALRPRTEAAVAALHAALRDPVPAVASAVMAAMCRAREATQAALAPATAEAARASLLTPGIAPEDAADMLSCLAASATAADAKILEQIRKGPPSPLRDRAAELLPAAPAPKGP